MNKATASEAAIGDRVSPSRSSVFGDVFRPHRLSVGLVLPLTEMRGDDTPLQPQLDHAALADRLGFAALWVRDVPLNSPDYPDPQGHLDPWVFLGALAARTQRIALGTAAIAAPVRHPLHIAKGAVSVDAATQGRFILGLGSGDRLPEYAAFGRDAERRGDAFRAAWSRISAAVTEPSEIVPDMTAPSGPPFELLPRPVHGSVPMISVGSSHQSLGWIARNARAWMTYYRTHEVQRDRFALWHDAVGRLEAGSFRGLGQSFQLELLDTRTADPEPLPLGMRLGAVALVEELRKLRAIGAHHVLLNLDGTNRPIAEVLTEISIDVIPHINE